MAEHRSLAEADRRRRPERRLRRSRPRRRPGRRSAARLALRHPQLRRRRPLAGRAGLPGHRPVPARLRHDALPLGGDAAQRPAGGPRASTSIALLDALEIERAIVGGLRLGRADGRHRRGALAGALHGARLGERVPDRQPGRPTSCRCRRRPSSSGGTSTTSPPSAAGPATTSTGATSPSSSGRPLRREWDFDDATFERSAASFDNPDHVAIVIHNYRWRLGLAEGEPQYDDLETAARRRPGHHRAHDHPRRRRQRRTAPGRRAPTPRSSRASTRTGRSRAASGTTCPRKPRRPSPRPSSTSTRLDSKPGHRAPSSMSRRSSHDRDHAHRTAADRRSRPRRVRRLVELERRHRAAAGGRGRGHRRGESAARHLARLRLHRQRPRADPRPGARRRPLVRRRGDHATPRPTPRTSSAWSSSPPSPRTRASVWARSRPPRRTASWARALVPLHYPTGQGDETAVEFAIDPAQASTTSSPPICRRRRSQRCGRDPAPGRRAGVLRADRAAGLEGPARPGRWSPPATRRPGPTSLRSMAERAGATITEVDGSHVIMISQPQAVDRRDPGGRRRGRRWGTSYRAALVDLFWPDMFGGERAGAR